ncbi:S28 family serine protease [Streptomyces sp. NPDC012888]|uniref:S28 family serine protease n=1 Tax=Streptomyces sp. NPDC012888 TaxID=3364855 RepID=UPI00369D2855
MKQTLKHMLFAPLLTGVLTVTGLSGPAVAQGVPPGPAAAEGGAQGRTPAEDVLARIAAVPGLRVTGERPAPAPGQIVLDLAYRQPVDHRRPGGASFEQRLTLLHKSTARPMVLYSSGYDLGSSPQRPTEPTELLDANQITVEQRFFGTSRPAGDDWSALTIWQAASDHHRLVSALRGLYGGAWISTGGSKGGMTAVYHRRFYPDDVAGTVAYAAPNNTDDRDDSAYDAALERVGTPECRAALKAVQREALERRAAMTARYAHWAGTKGVGFEIIGGVDRAFELAVLRLPLMFWMHQPTGGCAGVPAATATDDALYAWVDRVTRLEVYADPTLKAFTAYFHQLGTELGYPAFAAPHLAGLLRYPGVQEVRSYVPRDVPLRFRRGAMADVDRWVRRDGRALMFVNGENDVAVAEPFRLGKGTRDSFAFTVPRANHHLSIRALPPADAARATEALRRWAGAGRG